MNKLVCIVAFQVGCLGPLASDVVETSSEILPPGTVVPPLDAPMLAELDGVDELVILESAFAEGVVVRVWDFGPAPSFAAPLFVLVERDAQGELTRIDHNTIVAVVPGDPGYSPFWAVLMLEVTDRYAGEIVPSFAAVDQAIELGLVKPPVLQVLAVNCPVVAPDVRLDVGGGAMLPPNATFYYEGHTVPYFDFGSMPLVDRSTVPEQRSYQLRREGQEPLSELVRNVDMTGDGDLNDTNDIYTQRPDVSTSSPLVRLVRVVVPEATSSIDVTRDETMATLTSATQLFAPDPQATVVGYEVTDDPRNRPAQRQPGGL